MKYATSRENPISSFPTRYDTNQAVQTQMVRGLKRRGIAQCSENKGYRATYLCHCLRRCKMQDSHDIAQMIFTFQ